MRSETFVVPLFPLPRGALLPGELLPLHIFEPRYRALLEEVRGSDNLAMAIGTLDPGWEADYLGRPAVAPVVGLGQVLRDKQRPDGTSDIALHGLGRARLLEELPSEPYRRIRVEVPDPRSAHPVEAYRMRRRLLTGLDDALGSALEYDVTAAFDASHLVDSIASSLSLQPLERVRMMQALDAEERVALLLELLRTRDHRRRLTQLVPSLGKFHLSLPDGEETA